MLCDALDRYPDTRLVVVDTLGRIMPLPLQGETTYQRDYRVARRAQADRRRAARPDDRRSSTTPARRSPRTSSTRYLGTHGLAGAADTIMVLSRSRGKGEGILRVTGRDVIEADYAVKFCDGAWSLDGDTLPRPAPTSGAAPRPARSATGPPRSSSSSASAAIWR